MRTLGPIALALLAGGCLAPGQPDPTRYPWDQPQAKTSYCVVSLETPSSTGISTTRAVPDSRVLARGAVPPFEQVPPASGVAQLACVPPQGQ